VAPSTGSYCSGNVKSNGNGNGSGNVKGNCNRRCAGNGNGRCAEMANAAELIAMFTEMV
jgi:hypothetical protein